MSTDLIYVLRDRVKELEERCMVLSDRIDSLRDDLRILRQDTTGNSRDINAFKEELAIAYKDG